MPTMAAATRTLCNWEAINEPLQDKDTEFNSLDKNPQPDTALHLLKQDFSPQWVIWGLIIINKQFTVSQKSPQ